MRVYENENGRRKNRKKESTRNMALEEKKENSRKMEGSKEKEENVRERTRERLSGGGRKDYEGLNWKTKTTKIYFNHYF